MIMYSSKILYFIFTSRIQIKQRREKSLRDKTKFKKNNTNVFYLATTNIKKKVKWENYITIIHLMKTKKKTKRGKEISKYKLIKKGKRNKL